MILRWNGGLFIQFELMHIIINNHKVLHSNYLSQMQQKIFLKSRRKKNDLLIITSSNDKCYILSFLWIWLGEPENYTFSTLIKK